MERKIIEHLKKHMTTIIVGIVCLALGFGGGYVVFYQPHVTTTVKLKETVDNKTLRQVYSILKDKFVDTTGSKSSISDRMIKGLTSGLLDPHTSYMTKKEAEAFTSSISGNYVGIGVAYLVVNEGAMITDAFSAGNAYKAGLRPGDIITDVDGVSLKGKSSDEMQDMIRGEEDSSVNFSYRHLGKKKNVHIKRTQASSGVFSKVLKSGKKKVGYLQITTFDDETGSTCETALSAFEDQNVEDLIIDVRNNGGGYVNAAEDTLSLFNPSGTVLYSTKDRKGKVDHVKDSDRHYYTFKKKAILVNGQTASAAEILAGSLHELNGFSIIGSQTYGKGTMQAEVPLSNGGVLKYTCATWYTAKGKSINHKGLTPDVKVNSVDMDTLDIKQVSKTYKVGAMNTKISAMEDMLKALGYHVDRTDGYFSNQTSKALKAFQKKSHLKVTGTYGTQDYYYLIYQFMNAKASHSYDPEFKKAQSFM